MRKASLAASSVLLLAALGLLTFRPDDSVGAVWASIDPNSLVGFGSLIEKKVDPGLWTGAILPILQWPAWPLALALGAALALAARPWKRASR